MIIKNGTDAAIEERKRRLNLEGDVYIYEGHFIKSLESHRRLVPEAEAASEDEGTDGEGE